MSLNAAQEEDFRRFVDANWHPLVRTAFLLVGDHGRAEDLVQQVLVSVHRRWASVDTEGSPTGYVRAALANQAISDSRRHRVRETLFGGLTFSERGSPPPGFDRDPHDAYHRIENRDALLGALKDLPPRMRAAVVLRYFDDLSEAATAQALEMSLGSVKSQTSRGLQRMRESLSATMNEGSLS